MRSNLPVSTVEHKLRTGEFIVSTTDLKGLITYVNPTFLEISGFTEQELIGAPHNIVRHPDMPAPAFGDLWATLQKGKPWSGLVKNRCKNGDYYWVRANAAPIWQGDSITGYISVRTAPSQTEIDAAEAIYRAVREGRAGKVMVLEGSIVSARSLAGLWRKFTNSTLKSRLIALTAIMGGIPLAANLATLSGPAAAALSGVSLIAGALIARWVYRDVSRPLAKTVKDMSQISQGHMDVATLAGADNEVGHVLSALKALHIRVGFDLAEARRIADEALRIKIGLDNVSTGVMIADTDRKIIYANKSVVEILTRAEDDIKKQLPKFSAANMVGVNIDTFHKEPAHQARLLASLSGTHTAALTIGPRHMVVRASPVINERGQRLGSVAEWTDHTAEVAVEQEVAELVNAAAAGDFSRRLNPAGKEGFFLQLAEGINRLVETSERGMNDVAAVLAALSEGDLTREMAGDYQGLFAELKDSANTTSGRLREIVGQIREATDAINTAAREIASGNADLSSRTESQASSLEETASSMDELTSTVKNNADNARQANQLALDASGIAVKGGEMVGEVVHTMSAISESSNKIADIISVIDGIAFQTNILALNAAVEAARAGEQGRGFAVVAGEVRNLAQRSAAAAKEIKQLINDSVGKVDAGYKVVEQAGQTMQEIVQSVKRVTDIMAEINAASTEQSQGIEQVNVAVAQMDEMTQQNAALVEEAAAAAESLQDQADGLAQAVSVFKIGGSGALAAPRQAVARAPAARPLSSATKGAGGAPRPAPAPRPVARPAASGTDEDEWQEF